MHCLKLCFADRLPLPGDVAFPKLHLPCLSATVAACTCQQDMLSDLNLQYTEHTVLKNRTSIESH